jgi:hypothetical protein
MNDAATKLDATPVWNLWLKGRKTPVQREAWEASYAVYLVESATGRKVVRVEEVMS